MSDGFLSRWTRRKLAVRAAERAQRAAGESGPDADDSAGPRGEGAEAAAAEGPPAVPDTAATAVPAAAEPTEPTEPLPELPALDALTPESDLAPFLRTGVPAALRNAALRRMWSLDPAIRDFVSEAREYAYDWNTPGGVPGLGPLLPSDDVQAMLRRIVGGLPGEASPPAGPGAEAREPDAEDGAAAPEPSAADEPGAVAPEEPGSVPRLAEPAPVAEAIPAALPEEADPLPRGPEAPAGAGTASRARLRRHGGAMPG